MSGPIRVGRPVRLVIVAVMVAGCSATPTAAPTEPISSGQGATPAATAVAADATSAGPTASPEPSIPTGDVRVRFHLDLTGGGVPSATFGLEVHELGKPSSGPVLLCSAHGGAPACVNGGGYERFVDLPLGATVDYRFFQELDPSGSPSIDIFPKEFVVTATSTYKAQTFDIQP